jgi:hypothetical protein
MKRKRRLTSKMRKVLAWAREAEKARDPTIDPERQKIRDACKTPSLKISRKIIRKAGGRVGP